MVAAAPSLLPPNALIGFAEKDGKMTSTTLQLLQQWRQSINGLTPTIACTATESSNVYSLTLYSVAPQVLDYFDFTGFAFVAPANSSGSVTAQVITSAGALSALPVYIGNGSSQAAAGDIEADRFYILYYVSNLGGFVIK